MLENKSKARPARLSSAQRTAIITAVISALTAVLVVIIPEIKEWLRNRHKDDDSPLSVKEVREREIAEKISQNIIFKHYDEVNDDFAEGLKASLSTDVIRTVSDSALANLGDFQRVMSVERDKDPTNGLDRVVVVNRFSKKPFYVLVTFTKESKVYGLFINYPK